MLNYILHDTGSSSGIAKYARSRRLSLPTSWASIYLSLTYTFPSPLLATLSIRTLTTPSIPPSLAVTHSEYMLSRWLVWLSLPIRLYSSQL